MQSMILQTSTILVYAALSQFPSLSSGIRNRKYEEREEKRDRGWECDNQRRKKKESS